MTTKVQLTIYADDQTTATGTGPITDPDVIAAARIVLDHLADNAAGITKEAPAEPEPEPTTQEPAE